MSSNKTEIWPDKVKHETKQYPPAVSVGDWVFLSGQMATNEDGDIAEEAKVDPEFPHYRNGHTLQSKYILDQIKNIVNDAGGSFDDIVRIYQWWEAPEEDQEWLNANGWTSHSITRYLEQLYGDYIEEKSPGSTGMGVKGLMGEDRILMVDGMVHTGDGEKNAVSTVPDIPQPDADYSEVVEKGGFVFTAGEVPTDFVGDWGVSELKTDRSPDPHSTHLSAVAPEARTNPYLWYGDEIRNHTEYTLEKLDSIVEEIDTPIENTVKAEIYLPDPTDFVGFEEIWEEWFPENPPARVVAPHQGLGLKGNRVEIALQLVHPDADIEVEHIATAEAPEPVTHQPQAVRAGELLFISGQMSIDKSGQLMSEAGAQAQMNQILDNTAAICNAAGTSLENVVSTKCFYSDLSKYSSAMEAFTDRFEEGNRPANVPMEVGEPLLIPDCDILLDVIAYVP